MKFTTSVRVRYAETDQMGVVYHGNYFSWFEVGRVEMLRSLGFSYAELESEGCVLPVLEARCRYRRPARYDDLLGVETVVETVRGSVLVFSYAVWKEAVLLAEGETKHLVVDRTMRRTRLPERYQAALLRTLG